MSWLVCFSVNQWQSSWAAFTEVLPAVWHLINKVSQKKHGFIFCLFYSPQSKEGKSPLHMAAIHGRFTRSQILIQNGNKEHIVWLISEKCCCRLFSPPNGTLIHSIFPPFISGGEIDCVDKYGNTPLHVAAKYGHELLISTLMTNGADTARYCKAISAIKGCKNTIKCKLLCKKHWCTFSVSCIMAAGLNEVKFFRFTVWFLNSCSVLFIFIQTWDSWNVPLALSCAVRVFRLLSQVTLLRFVCFISVCAILLTSTSLLIHAWTYWSCYSYLFLRCPAGQLYSIVSSMSKEHVLSAGFDINTPDNFGRTCLHAAASGG